MTTTLDDMDPIVIHAAQVLAERSHRSVGAVVSELARKGLAICDAEVTGAAAASEAIPTSQRNRFPIFVVPADTKPVAGDDVKKILANEDLSA